MTAGVTKRYTLLELEAMATIHSVFDQERFASGNFRLPRRTAQYLLECGVNKLPARWFAWFFANFA